MNIILTGATGMVGEGVLHEALISPKVERITLLGRSPSGVLHPKVREIVHENLFDLSSIEDQLSGFDACLFCLGTTSVGKKEAEYHRITHDLTLSIAETLARKNPSLTFCYISAMGANASGRSMWARVKGETENDLRKLPFKSVYCFRPGYLHPTPGLVYTQKYYRYIQWMYPLLKIIVPGRACRLSQLGKAMVNIAQNGYPKAILEVIDIIAASK